MASDDNAELWLNTAGADPAGQIRIINNTGYKADWLTGDTPTYVLAAGYYAFTIVHQEGGGGDWFKAGVQLNGAGNINVIGSPASGIYLSAVPFYAGTPVAVNCEPSKSVGIVLPTSFTSGASVLTPSRWVVTNNTGAVGTITGNGAFPSFTSNLLTYSNNGTTGNQVFGYTASNATATTNVAPITITVKYNDAPVVSMNPDTFSLTTEFASIVSLSVEAVSVTDDNLPYPATLSFLWSQDSGPKPVTFSSATVLKPKITFPEVGQCVLSLVASDGQLSSIPKKLTVSVIPSKFPDKFTVLVGPSPFDPARGSLRIGYFADVGSVVTVKMYDMGGSLVWQTAVTAPALDTSVSWDGRNLRGNGVATGAYTCSVTVVGTDGKRKEYRQKVLVMRKK